MNPLKPDLLTPAERLAEATDILARGLVRLRARQSRRLSADTGDSWLDCPVPESGHATVFTETGSQP